MNGNNKSILHSYNRPVEMKEEYAVNNRQSLERATMRDSPILKYIQRSKVTDEAKIMKSFLKFPYSETEKYALYPTIWVIDWRKYHPNKFLPTLQVTFGKWMMNYSKQHQLQKQRGLVVA
jgi:hypothetical protein